MLASGIPQTLAAIALWSSLALLGLKLRHMPPFLLLGCALLIGAAPGLARMRWRALSPAVLLLGLYGLFAYHFCLFLALRRAPPVEANLLNYLWPLLIVVLAPAFDRANRLAPRHLLAALCGFAGAALLVTGGQASFAAEHASGYALAVAAAMIWSTFTLASRRFAAVPTSAIGPVCLAAGLLGLACHALLEPAHAWSAQDALWLAAIGLGPMGAAFYLWDHGIKRGDPRTIGILSYLTPLGSTLAIVAAGEGRLSPLAAWAMTLIVGGAVLGTWPGRTPAGRGGA